MPDTPPAEGEAAMTRMRAIADGLSDAGLKVRLNEGRYCIDVIATAKGVPGSREIDVVVDEDNYVELSYWNAPATSPAQTVDVIIRTIALIARNS